jgi:hypothetical protein
MTHGAESAAGWFLGAKEAWWFLWIWLAVVLIHGLWRSRGDAPQDPIRPSGPGVE